MISSRRSGSDNSPKWYIRANYHHNYRHIIVFIITIHASQSVLACLRRCKLLAMRSTFTETASDGKMASIGIGPAVLCLVQSTEQCLPLYQALLQWFMALPRSSFLPFLFGTSHFFYPLGSASSAARDQRLCCSMLICWLCFSADVCTLPTTTTTVFVVFLMSPNVLLCDRANDIAGNQICSFCLSFHCFWEALANILMGLIIWVLQFAAILLIAL